ncbi:flagellar hook assembly protein FlgD [Cytobacillus sp. S13-E01]|uniref:flagellar hook assembly protein FlgD n=1 Tax=Cytobacillus sp. S13-E01 TaxID=3031326 RepID=UPI0023D88541|nr:flagellar hook assembly protein FlgD [Cytobacillus sp. S13-E01]MDF0725183.1 flagellar hook assembly protein FlgD [Cytobacillus sp. S13-E01]
MASRIDSSLYLSNNQQKRKTGNDILGKDDFLRILMTQLQNQDPMNPMQDKDFIAQMATFSSLEQMTNINKTMESFVNSQNGDLLLKYSSMIGKELEWGYKSTDSDGNEVNNSGIGIVKSIKQKGTEIELELEDGTKVFTDEIIKVSLPQTSND